MGDYEIDLKYVNSHEQFVLEVLACIYEEVKFLIKEKKLECQDSNEFTVYSTSLRKAMDKLLRSYKMIFKARKDTIKTFTETSDMLEMIENATAMIKIQENANGLLKFFDDKSIHINIKGEITHEYVTGELLPDLHDKILFRFVDLK